MKFWLRTGSDSIYLDQFFKAMGWGDDYQDIRHVIERGEVTVNDEMVRNRRKELREGDRLRWRGYHVIIAGKKMAREDALMRQDMGHVMHNRTPIEWTEKPIKKPEKKK